MMPNPESVIYSVLAVSFSLNVVFLRRLLGKIDRVADALFNTDNGVIIRLDRLEHSAERRMLARNLIGGGS